MNCCIRWPLCGADVTGHCPNVAAAKGAEALLDAHPMDCPCLACLHAFGAQAQARAWTVTAPDTTTAPTVRPPADQRCDRCSRILIATPCPCVTPVERYLRAADERDAAWAVLTAEERIEAIRRRAA